MRAQTSLLHMKHLKINREGPVDQEVLIQHPSRGQHSDRGPGGNMRWWRRRFRRQSICRGPDGCVWVHNAQDAIVWRIEPGTNLITRYTFPR